MKTITFVNHKGGVGKTTVTVNLAAELADRGKKVLLVDLDSQGNLTQAAGTIFETDIEEDKNTIADAMNTIVEKGKKALDVVPLIHQTTLHENIQIIPNDIRFARTLLNVFGDLKQDLLLKSILREIKEIMDYDFALVDCAPSISIDFRNAAVASDEIVIVCQGEFSIGGMITLIDVIDDVKDTFNPDLNIAGILVNGIGNNNADREVEQFIKDSFGDQHIFEKSVPQSTTIKEAISYSKGLRDFMENISPSKRSATALKAVEAFAALADELIAE